MAKVSVIVPVHNTQHLLDACVRSLLDQSLSDIEIILVENASSDDSLKKCQEWAAADKRIKVLHYDIGDLPYARNRGVEVATSEYVAFVDSDDTITLDMYENLYNFALENDLDIVYCNHVQLFDDLPPKYKFKETGERRVYSSKELLMLNLTQQIPVSSCPMIVRRSLFDDMSFPEFVYYEDRAFTFKLINACNRAGYIDKAYYNYYQRSGSIVHSFRWKNYYDYADAERQRLKFIVNSGVFTEQEQVILSKIVAESLLSKLKRANHKAKTDQQKKLSKEMIEDLSLIPEGCKIRFKYRIYLFILKYFYRWI